MVSNAKKLLNSQNTKIVHNPWYVYKITKANM